MKLPQLDSNNLFIFTDASVTKYGRHEEEYISCSGAVACVWTGNCYQIIDQSFVINRCSTNNNGEIKAIYYGLLLALKYKNNFRTINLFSDSKISIYGLREWIEDWVQRSRGDQLLGSTNVIFLILFELYNFFLFELFDAIENGIIQIILLPLCKM